jgi:hypothetical protein
MPAAGNLSHPEVGGVADLNADDAARQSGKEPRDLAPAQAWAQNHLPGSVNPVDPENVFAPMVWLRTQAVALQFVAAKPPGTGIVHTMRAVSCSLTELR